jgi:hypothetical protein
MKKRLTVLMVLLMTTSACGFYRADPVNQPATLEHKQHCTAEAKQRFWAAQDRHKTNQHLGASFGLLGGLIASQTDPAPEDRDYHMSMQDLYKDCMMQKGYEF